MKTKVLIVGGGISGIKAAIELQKANIDYILLEAKSELGGRLKTVQGKNSKYDLGASWFHETLNNALFDEENELSLKSSGKLNHYYDDSPIKLMTSKGSVIPGDLKLSSIINEINKYVEVWNQNNLGVDESYYETVIRYLKEKHHLLSDDQINYSLQFSRSLELWHGIDIFRMSSKYASIDNEGRDVFALHYDKVLKRHIDLIDPRKIKLNTIVKSITKKKDRNKNSIIEIITNNNEAFKSEYVIVSVPQSILQLKDPGEKAFIKFEPSLPSRILDSLDNIHFGALGKVVFEFNETFWPTDSERILMLADPPVNLVNSIRQKKTIEIRLNVEELENWRFPILFLNLSTTLNKPTLIALTQSPTTEYFESNPDQVWEFFKPVIERLSSKSKIPSPINQIVTNWTIDPFQKGSYSACYPGDDPLSAIIALEEGFGNIRFAGEHTILEGAGCVHGAWNSGKREAEYIIERFT